MSNILLFFAFIYASQALVGPFLNERNTLPDWLNLTFATWIGMLSFAIFACVVRNIAKAVIEEKRRPNPNPERKEHL